MSAEIVFVWELELYGFGEKTLAEIAKLVKVDPREIRKTATKLLDAALPRRKKPTKKGEC